MFINTRLPFNLRIEHFESLPHGSDISVGRKRLREKQGKLKEGITSYTFRGKPRPKTPT
jgi:hypothetical protein